MFMINFIMIYFGISLLIMVFAELLIRSTIKRAQKEGEIDGELYFMVVGIWINFKKKLLKCRESNDVIGFIKLLLPALIVLPITAIPSIIKGVVIVTHGILIGKYKNKRF